LFWGHFIPFPYIFFIFRVTFFQPVSYVPFVRRQLSPS
jgi:hypothetical protein